MESDLGFSKLCLCEFSIDSLSEEEPMKLDNREVAMILAALRYWQREGIMSSGYEVEVASDSGRWEPLSVGEIDRLCERLNGGER